MNQVFHPANERGYANHGWLEARHSFSFASWYNPEKVHFGALRVINDDKVAPGMGFATHPHDNMEIITIPLEGELRHRDNMGNEGVIKPGELQIMSAGSGVTHSEFNGSRDSFLRLFQIWIFPNKKNVEPRYQQIDLTNLEKNQFNLLVGPENGESKAWIHQDAFISSGEFDEQKQVTYKVHREGNGIYILQVHGTSEISGKTLQERDAIGLWNIDEVEIAVKNNSRILIFEVPMTF